MPSLDVSFVLGHAMLADRFNVIRRAESVNTFGEVIKPETVYPNVAGVVCMASPNDLERLDDNQRMGRHLSIVTRFRLQGPSQGFQPDIVVWNGDRFVIQTIDPYTNYGRGFVQAIAGSIQSQDSPPRA